MGPRLGTARASSSLGPVPGPSKNAGPAGPREIRVGSSLHVAPDLEPPPGAAELGGCHAPPRGLSGKAGKQRGGARRPGPAASPTPAASSLRLQQVSAEVRLTRKPSFRPAAGSAPPAPCSPGGLCPQKSQAPQESASAQTPPRSSGQPQDMDLGAVTSPLQWPAGPPGWQPHQGTGNRGTCFFRGRSLAHRRQGQESGAPHPGAWPWDPGSNPSFSSNHPWGPAGLLSAATAVTRGTQVSVLLACGRRSNNAALGEARSAR